MKRVLQHKWQSLPGFRRARCEKCGLVREWSQTLQRMVYHVPGQGYMYFPHQCILENCTMSKTEKK